MDEKIGINDSDESGKVVYASGSNYDDYFNEDVGIQNNNNNNFKDEENKEEIKLEKAEDEYKELSSEKKIKKNEQIERINTHSPQHKSFESYLHSHKDDNSPSRPVWKRDTESKNCSRCKAEFGLITRRHHCRACGEIFCGNCTQGKVSLKHLGYVGPQRVCIQCEREIKKNPPKMDIKRRSTIIEPIIQGNFILTDRIGRHINTFRFSLTDTAFYWGKSNLPPTDQPKYFVNLSDVLSVTKANDDEFVVHSFPWGTPKKEARIFRDIRVKCGSPEERDQWIDKITSLLTPALPFKPENPRKILVLINPFSGKKVASTVWREVEPIFRLVPVTLTIRKTERIGHAIEIVQQMHLDNYDGIITVSGDGLVFEVVNGLMKRDDWETAIKIPIGTIPAGSGNALAATLNSISPITAAFNICKGTMRPFDLMKVIQPKVDPTYCFLSINWGIISDVDFESEKFRVMGGARFTVGALVRITNLRYYRGRIAYLPAKENYKTFCEMNENCPQCVPLSLREFPETLQQLVPPYNIKDAVPEEEEGWEVLDTEFVTVVGCNISKLSFDVHAAPFAHLSDGYIDLLIVEKCSRSELLSIFADIDTGAFVNNSAFNQAPFVKYVKVKAFTLLTKTNTGAFGFDGERAQTYESLHVSNLRGIATIMG